MEHLVANFPALMVFGGVSMRSNLQLTEDKGYCRVSSINIVIRAFPKDKYEWIRKFTVGGDDENGVWAYGTGSMITSEQRSTEIAIGYELGDQISIEGKQYVIESAPNHNIKFVEV